MTEKKHNYFYKITNLVNGKYYYGIRSCDKLPDNKYMGGGTAIKKAIKKYGKKNFTKEIIADYSTRKEASYHEARVVTPELIQIKECYNIRTGGDNEFIFKHTEEAKRKISEAGKGRECSEETRLKLSKIHNGKVVTKETKLKLSQSNRGKTHTEEAKIKISEAGKGRKHSQETKYKLRHLKLGKPLSEEHRNKLRHLKLGKTHTEEAKRKMSESSTVKSKCVIYGILYNSITEASTMLNIPTSTVSQRILSKTNLWEDWKKYEDMHCLN